MQNAWERGECACVIGSMTRAIRAQKLLMAKGVRTEVVPTEGAGGGRGCSYALSYSCDAGDTVSVILQNAGITPRGSYGGGR